MSRLFSIIYIALSLFACKTKSQDMNHVVSSLKLFKEGSDLMLQGFKLEISDSPFYRNYYEKAIEIFLSSYKLDTSNIELGTYLSNLYYKVQKFDSALIWGLKQLPLDSTNNAAKVPIAFANSLNHLGLCYLNIGDILTGRKYLKRALVIDKTKISILAQQLLDLSHRVFNKIYPSQIQELLQRKINLCEYSLDILNLGLEIGKGNRYVEEFLITQGKIKEREKNCR